MPLFHLKRCRHREKNNKLAGCIATLMHTKIEREGIFTVGLKYWSNFQKDQILFLAKWRF